MNQSSEGYLEDFAVGQTFRSRRLRLDECRWPRPVHPGDELRVECEVIEVRPSKSRPEKGLIKLRTTTLNQDDEPVQVHVVNLLVPRRKDIRQQSG
jgi:acyl dehydratase